MKTTTSAITFKCKRLTDEDNGETFEFYADVRASHDESGNISSLPEDLDAAAVAGLRALGKTGEFEVQFWAFGDEFDTETFEVK